jgi:hypothetical protein
MRTTDRVYGVLLWLALFAATGLTAQTSTAADAVLQRIGEEGTSRSQLERLGQVLLDSLGPRLTGTPESEAASAWVVETYRSWGIEARQERYGTWMGWRRGPASLALVSPRARSLEGTLLAWSPGTGGPVTGAAIFVPSMRDSSDLDRFLEASRGRFVLLSPPEPSCRPEENWREWGSEAAVEAARAQRAAAYRAFAVRLQSTGVAPAELIARLEQAGAAGFLTSRWPEAWGVQTVHDTWSGSVPSFDLSCEDYGLVHRLAERGQSPVLQVDARAERLGEVPVWNTVAEIRGHELPDEYVILSAHFDSWDSASGATDNGAGTITMMEALRILKAAYPNPRRTLLVGHWNGEEQGLNGSRAFAADHPEIVSGLQALFNQDEGTGRITRISMQGLAKAGATFRRWFSRMPPGLVGEIELTEPGAPSAGGSDEASFICAGAPAFRLSSLSWDYGPYTWHTNRDTFDKLVLDELKTNATLTAMLAYLASEDPERVSRDRADLSIDPVTGSRGAWPECRDGVRSFR